MDILKEYNRQNLESKEAYIKARKVLPGGNTRTALYWPPFPLCMRRGKGTSLWDVDGNERTDFNFNNTTLIMGHNHPEVIAAAKAQLELGTVLGAPTETEQKLAEELTRRLGTDDVRFTPSGTEANMQALRVARSYTGKPRIAKCYGAYHGSWDAVILNPEDKSGVPEDVLKNTLFFPYNNAEAAEQLIKKNYMDLAAVIIEPTQRDLSPRPGFLQQLREATRERDVLLVFDEVISFRLSLGGAQKLFDVKPDITTMGKIIGGGFPVGAYSSSEEIMSPLNIKEVKLPEMSTPKLGFSGTFNAHPLAMSSGLKVMKLMTEDVYDSMAKVGERARKGLSNLLSEEGYKAHVGGEGSFFHITWTDQEVYDSETASTGDRAIARYYSLGLMNRGIFKLGHPNVSAITGNDEVDKLLSAAEETFEDLKPLIRDRATNLLKT
jgi:glutamate-1-semialdehyde 2,1-aminomutase